MFAILAAIAAGTGVIINGTHAHTNAWSSPLGLLLLAVASSPRGK
ncbi:MAG TPA: hypothetical protein VN088_19120 [Nocardioides sp.]|nr:hypothetical protein [Nocardioides sp.]